MDPFNEQRTYMPKNVLKCCATLFSYPLVIKANCKEQGSTFIKRFRLNINRKDLKENKDKHNGPF